MVGPSNFRIVNGYFWPKVGNRLRRYFVLSGGIPLVES